MREEDWLDEEDEEDLEAMTPQEAVEAEEVAVEDSVSPPLVKTTSKTALQSSEPTLRVRKQALGIERNPPDSARHIQSEESLESEKPEVSVLDALAAWTADTSLKKCLCINLDWEQEIAGVVLQGHPDRDEWVTKVRVQVMGASTDAISDVLICQRTHVAEHVEVPLVRPLFGRTVIIYPVEYKGAPSMRAGIMLSKVQNPPESRRSYSSAKLSLFGGKWSSVLKAPEPNGWEPNHKAACEWLQLDLGGPMLVEGVSVEAASADFSFDVLYSLEGHVFFSTGETCRMASDVGFGVTVEARYVRLVLQEVRHLETLRAGVLISQDFPTSVLNPPESQREYSSKLTAGFFSMGGTILHESTLDSRLSWRAYTNDTSQWMQLDLGEVRDVVGVLTQGRGDSKEQVTEFTVQFALELSGPEGWRAIPAVFNRLSDDQSEAVVCTFPSTVKARYLRLCPRKWSGHIAMRAAVLLHQADQAKQELTASADAYTLFSECGALCDPTTGLRRFSSGHCSVSRYSLLNEIPWKPDLHQRGEWMHFDLGDLRTVVGVTLQGGRLASSDGATRVTFEYGRSDGVGETLEVPGWHDVSKLCSGPNDDLRVLFEQPILARWLRIVVQEFQGSIALRAAVVVAEVHPMDRRCAAPRPLGTAESHPAVAHAALAPAAVMDSIVEVGADIIEVVKHPEVGRRWNELSDDCRWWLMLFGGFLVLFAIALVAGLLPASCHQLGQQRWGLLINKVDNTMPLDRVYDPGRYWIGPSYTFMEYPSTLGELTLTPAIRDKNGKQFKLTIGVQYQLLRDKLPLLWRQAQFGYVSYYETRLMDSFIKTGNDLLVSDMWETPALFRSKLKTACEAALLGAHATCVFMQVLAVSLDSKLNAVLIKTQVTKQAQRTALAEKKADTFRAETQAILAQKQKNITVIAAQGQATVYQIEATASAQAGGRLTKLEQDTFEMLQRILFVKSTGQVLDKARYREYRRLIMLQDQEASNWVLDYRSGKIRADGRLG